MSLIILSVHENFGAVADDGERFRSHVEEEVDDAQVGQEAVAMAEHLIIFLWFEMRWGSLPLGCEEEPEVFCIVCSFELAGQFRFWLQVYKVADGVAQGFVEVEQIFPRTFIERTEVIGVVLKERACRIGCNECLPMEMLPVTVVADEYVFYFVV